MSRIRFVHVALAIVATLAIFACEDAVGPFALSGTYSLASIDGAGPPLIVGDCLLGNGERSVLEIAYDSMTFTSDSTIYRQQLVGRTIYRPDGSKSGPYMGGDSYPGHFVREDGRIIVKWRSSLNPSVNGTDTIRVERKRLSLLRLVELRCREDSSELQMATFIYSQQ